MPNVDPVLVLREEGHLWLQNFERRLRFFGDNCPKSNEGEGNFNHSVAEID
jgi:hypothetical protein